MTELVERSSAVQAPVRVDDLDLPVAAFAAPRTRRWTQRAWVRAYVTALIGADVLSTATAATVGWSLRAGLPGAASGPGYLLVGVLVTLGWLLALQMVGAYEIRRITTASREVQRALRAAAHLGGGVALIAYLDRMEIARGYVLLVIPLGLGLMLTARMLLRRAARYRRIRGDWTSTILAVGTTESVQHLVDVTRRNPASGLVVVGACVEDAEAGAEIAPGVPVLGSVWHAAPLAEQVEADIVAVAGTGLGPRRIRELGWAIEGTGRAMVMAPGLTDVAGPRLHVSPVEGLPLMWVDQPQFTGLARVAKRAMDVAGAGLLLLLGAPLLLLIGLLVRLTSRGPALYRSARMGEHGREITVWKFRSMYVGADRDKHALADRNETDGVLFKMREDPRVTPFGRLLRKFSLDELPQLFNVIGGSMSLVGPRPPLRDEVERYDQHVHRRLLVKPGMTGLWQVSGRSDLPWEEAVRLDLYYVENWSLGLDLAIILRTMWAVVRSRGAY